MSRMGVRVSSPEISQTRVGIRNSRLINANKAFWKQKIETNLGIKIRDVKDESVQLHA